MKKIETLKEELMEAHQKAKEAGEGYIIGLDRRFKKGMSQHTIIQFCKEYGIEVEEPEAVEESVEIEESVECSPMRAWAKENGLEDVYDQYLDHCMDIADECAAEGYPSNGSNYELRVERIREYYPELFPEC